MVQQIIITNNVYEVTRPFGAHSVVTFLLGRHHGMDSTIQYDTFATSWR
jgi:hypothetical protein